jgi:hypothetical protein
MPPSVTVKAVRTAEKTRLEQAVLAAQQELVTVDSALTTAVDDAATKSQILAALQAAESVLRQQLAAASMPADVDQLDQDLEANLLAQRPALAALAAAQDTVATLTRRRQRVAAAGDLARAQQAAADASLTLAKTEDDQANLWRAALDGQALKAAVLTAKSATVTTLVANATSQLKVLLGKPDLFDLLQSRFKDAVTAAAERDARAERAADALDAVMADRAPVDGDVLTKADRFARQRQLVRAVVERSEQQLAWAQAILQGAAGAAVVTTSEQARINARAAAAIAAPNAATREKAVHDAQVKARAAAAALEKLTLPKLALDPTYDATADATVATELAASTSADADLATKTTAFTAGNKATIDQWEVALPPPLTVLVTDALRAMAAIDKLANNTVLATMLTDFDKAEEDYAKALQEQGAAQLLADAAAGELAARLDDAAAVLPVTDLRVAALGRGDQ